MVYLQFPYIVYNSDGLPSNQANNYNDIASSHTLAVTANVTHNKSAFCFRISNHRVGDQDYKGYLLFPVMLAAVISCKDAFLLAKL